MRETGLFRLVAAYDINPEALKACEQEDGAKPMPSYEALLDVPGIDAVVISTGAKFHAEQTLAAMERGLHVFVEKPLCATAAEIDALLKMQKRKKVVVGVGHNDHMSDAASATIKRMIDSGEMGAIATFEKTTAHNGGLCIKPGDWRGDPAKNPGGMLFQCGVHSIHELMYYFGPIRSVSCRMRYDVHTTKTADVAICHLEFASGLIGSLNAYHVTPYRHTFSLFGTKKNLYREDLCFDEGTQLHTQITKLDGKKEPKVPLPIEGKSDICGNLRNFYDAVVNGRAPYPSLLDGARAVAVVFAAEDSARSGKMVEVPSLAK
jgi:predicted dehydrogenase